MSSMLKDIINTFEWEDGIEGGKRRGRVQLQPRDRFSGWGKFRGCNGVMMFLPACAADKWGYPLNSDPDHPENKGKYSRNDIEFTMLRLMGRFDGEFHYEISSVPDPKEFHLVFLYSVAIPAEFEDRIRPPSPSPSPSPAAPSSPALPVTSGPGPSPPSAGSPSPPPSAQPARPNTTHSTGHLYGLDQAPLAFGRGSGYTQSAQSGPSAPPRELRRFNTIYSSGSLGGSGQVPVTNPRVRDTPPDPRGAPGRPQTGQAGSTSHLYGLDQAPVALGRPGGRPAPRRDDFVPTPGFLALINNPLPPNNPRQPRSGPSEPSRARDPNRPRREDAPTRPGDTQRQTTAQKDDVTPSRGAEGQAKDGRSKLMPPPPLPAPKKPQPPPEPPAPKRPQPPSQPPAPRKPQPSAQPPAPKPQPRPEPSAPKPQPPAQLPAPKKPQPPPEPPAPKKTQSPAQPPVPKPQPRPESSAPKPQPPAQPPAPKKAQPPPGPSAPKRPQPPPEPPAPKKPQPQPPRD